MVNLFSHPTAKNISFKYLKKKKPCCAKFDESEITFTNLVWAVIKFYLFNTFYGNLTEAI